jgi:hypothetical protein
MVYSHKACEKDKHWVGWNTSDWAREGLDLMRCLLDRKMASYIPGRGRHTTRKGHLL